MKLSMLDQDSNLIRKHKWLVENNASTEGETSSEILQISGYEEGQLTCDVGKCIDMSQRCNNIEVEQYTKYLYFKVYY